MTWNDRKWIRNVCSAAALLVVLAAPSWAEDEPGSKISGNLNLDFNTNFMSYGLDVWGTGDFDDAIFNPSFDLTWDLGEGWTVYGGTWWDVNNNADTSISDVIQEIDVWVGVGYTVDKLSISLTYQEWMYASDAERIVDLAIGYDTFLSPSLTVHGRVDGNGGQSEGAVFVLGVEHGIDVGPVSLSFPLNVAFLTEDYYVDGEGGFGYASLGVGGSIPLPISAAYGDWSLNAGLTYYYTDGTNIANPDDNIVTSMVGISVAF